MSSTLLVFLAAIAVSRACVPTVPTTTTVPCCSPLTSSNVPKVSPIGEAKNYHQCSILRRVSSTCPTTGYLLCSAAAETNPTNVIVQAIAADGSTILKSSSGNPMANLQVYCVKGKWKAFSDGSGADLGQVSCSQTGSTGAEFTYTNLNSANAAASSSSSSSSSNNEHGK